MSKFETARFKNYKGMKSFNTLIFMLLASFGVLAQNKIDSLQTVLDKTENEVDKIEVYARIAEQYNTINADSTLHYSLKAVELAEKHDNGIAKGQAYIAVGVGYQNKRMIEKSQEFFEKALKVALELDNNRMKSYAYNNMGNNYFFTSQHEKAIEVYIKSQEIDEMLGDAQGLIRSNTNLGIIYARLKQYDRSVKSYIKAQSIAKKIKHIGFETQVNVGLMNVYNYMEKLDSSIYYGRAAMKLSKEHKMAIGIARTAAGLSAPLIKNGNYNEGLEVAKLAEKYFIQFKEQDQINHARLNKAFAYEGLGEYKKARNIAKSLRENGYSYVQELERLMYKIEKSNGDFKKALMHHENYKSHVDSLRDKNNVDKLATLEKKFETQKKERAIERLEQEASLQEMEIKQKNTFLLVIISAVLLIAVAAFLVYQQKKLKHERSISDMEQKFLRFQMNPHFIFNSLTSIQNFMLKKDARQAGIYMAKFAKLMRQILENSRQDFISLDEEVETLKNYLDLQKLRLNNTFDYEINISDDLDADEINIPPMFAQPFIENSLEHGINQIEEGGLIKVNFVKDGNLVKIEIEDNGVGLEASKAVDTRVNHNSLATKITQERIALFNKELTEKIKLMIDNAVGTNGEVSGTKVNVMVPFK